MQRALDQHDEARFILGGEACRVQTLRLSSHSRAFADDESLNRTDSACRLPPLPSAFAAENFTSQVSMRTGASHESDVGLRSIRPLAKGGHRSQGLRGLAGGFTGTDRNAGAEAIMLHICGCESSAVEPYRMTAEGGGGEFIKRRT